MIYIKKPYLLRTERPYQNRAWRRAQAALGRYPGRIKAGLMAHWRLTTEADDPRLLLGLMHQYDNGRLVLADGGVGAIDNSINRWHN